MLTRRRLLTNAASLITLAPLRNANSLLANNRKRKFYIGACDWSLGKSSDIGAFDVAKQIGLDGLMVNMGSVKNNLHLRDKALQQSYLEAAK
ncbi:MAG: hypothetical protein ACR2KZ_06105 [Segetibacter sp.]